MYKYETTIRCKWMGDGSENLLDIAIALEENAKSLREMHADGIIMLEPMDGDYAFAYTDDKLIANKWGLYESENFEDEGDE